ncbi:hypothetical protein Pta6605_35430 [Pseudomonas amygdali pv. tabaci]|nr:hypothetical protein Pta6605_35430 [Pseudomonas amygdali pv. tabaci]
MLWLEIVSGHLRNGYDIKARDAGSGHQRQKILPDLIKGSQGYYSQQTRALPYEKT